MDHSYEPYVEPASKVTVSSHVVISSPKSTGDIYSQLPSSSVADSSKLQAVSSVQPLLIDKNGIAPISLIDPSMS